ncbi:MAG: hypothetical protein AAGE01_07750 [Pseudomonadota bacterium]
MIPESYEAWRHCIEVHCRIPLTREFITKRLRELDDRGEYSTEQLLRHYGESHVSQLRHWFQRAAADLG